MIRVESERTPPLELATAESIRVGTWLSLVEHSLGVRGVGSSNLPVPTKHPITVAVGTTITDRPPHRSVHARLRIRLLPRMNGVEALVGIRMQNTWVRNPPVEQWVETVPSHLRALAATN